MNAHVSGITLGVSDVNRAKWFYSEGLGWPIQQEQGEWVSFSLGNGSSALGLLPWDALAGGKIAKPAQKAQWGGYFGYFADPDGYLWKVAAGAGDEPFAGE